MGVTMQTSRLPGRLTAAWPWISTVARLGLAAVFLIAGGLKVGDLAASGRAVNAYQLMSFDVARVVGAIQPFLEIAVGLLLLAGLAVRLSAGDRRRCSWWSSSPGSSRPGPAACRSTAAASAEGGELTGGRTAQYAPEILRDVGFLVLAGILLVKPRTRYSVDGLLMGAQ